MNLENLKKSFFGYNKADVYQYIMSIESEFSAQLIKKDEQNKQAAEGYMERIRQLEKEMEELKKQLEVQKREQDMISFTMIEAKRYAEALKKESEEKEKKQQELWNEKLSKKEKELDEYDMNVRQIRAMFGKMLRALDEQTQIAEQQIHEVKEVCPSRDMSLSEGEDI